MSAEFAAGTALSIPPTSLYMTEQRYRRYSGDTTSPWHSTGNNIGIQGIIQLVEGEIRDHLNTFLCPTRIVEEEHRPLVLDRDTLELNFARFYQVATNYKRLLPGRGITVKWEVWTRGTCTATTTTGCAIVLNPTTGKLDLSRCYSGTGICTTGISSGILKVKVSYWSGFEALPIQIQRAIALLARYDAKELIAGVSPMMSELPWGAPTTQRSDLGISRSYDAPHRYAAGSQGISVFGREFVGIAAERLCAPFRVFCSWQI